MTTIAHDVVELREFVPFTLPEDALSKETAEELYRKYGSQIEIQAPTMFRDEWVLKPSGWIGYIPTRSGPDFSLLPKVALYNLFGMLECAYNIDFQFLTGDMHCQSLTEFYERLAHVFAKRVLARARRGFYREYVHEDDVLPYLRGRMDLHELARAPWKTNMACRYEDHTGNVEDNQILAWTLQIIARSGLCTNSAQDTVRAAFRSLQSFATLTPFSAGDCADRFYHRLNSDYSPMHGLCRFFLDHAGPTCRHGERQMLPFLINMSLLFERFVAAWLRTHLPQRYRVKFQDPVNVLAGVIRFDIDLVIEDTSTGRTVMILDTKYKNVATPSNADINQVVTYAEVKSCSEAVLIYPTHEIHPVDAHLGDIRVRTVAFDLNGDLDIAGHAMLQRLQLIEEDTAIA